MFFATHTLDSGLLLLINQQWRNPFFDAVMPILSSMTALMIAMGVALLFAVYKGGWRQVIFFLILLIGMGASDYSTKLVKHQVNRVRPLNAVALTHYREDGQWRQRPADFVRTKEKGSSYPSAHSANTMCLAVLALLLWPALKKWPLVLPLLVGYSRVYLGKHYPTDVMAGWLFGLAVGLGVWLLWEYGLKTVLPSKCRGQS